MNEHITRLGFDRFMALRWVNLALELRFNTGDPKLAFEQLKEWLSKEISGKETARKTATQIRRLWFLDHDSADELRSQVLESGFVENQKIWPFLHFGLSINIFPLFWDVCQAIGRLVNLQGACDRSEIQRRMQEKYVNPRSTKVATDRVIQTLIDWGFLIRTNGELSIKTCDVVDVYLTQWLIIALLQAQASNSMPLVDLSKSSGLLGIRFRNPREAIRTSSLLLTCRKGA